MRRMSEESVDEHKGNEQDPSLEELEKSSKPLLPAIGAESDAIFEMLEPMSFEDYKETLSFLEKVSAQKRYDRYKKRLEKKNKLLQENRKLYESIKTEMSDNIRKAGSQEDRLIHDAMLLDSIKKDMQQVREKQQNFITNYFNKQFMNAIQKLYAIVIGLGPDHPLNKLFHRHLGGLIEQEEEQIDKVDMVENLLAMENQLRDSEDVADGLYLKLFSETINKFKELETEQEALEKNAQKFIDEIEQLQQQLTEAKETFDELTPPEEVYKKLEKEVIAEIDDTTEEKSTTNFMINVLREANKKYTEKYDDLKKRIEGLKSDLETAVEEYGEFLTEEYDTYLQKQIAVVKKIDATQLEEADSLEALDSIYKGMRKRLYSKKTYKQLVAEYNKRFDRPLEELALGQLAEVQQEKDLELQSACYEWLQKDMNEERGEKLAEIDDTVLEFESEVIVKILKTRVQEYVEKVNKLKEKDDKYILLCDKLQTLLEKNTGEKTDPIIFEDIKKGIPGYFSEETDLFEIVATWNSEVDSIIQEKARLEKTIEQYAELLTADDTAELQTSLDTEGPFSYIDWRGSSINRIKGNLRINSAFRKYILLKRSIDYVERDKYIVVFTGRDIIVFSKDQTVLSILENDGGDYTQLVHTDMYEFDKYKKNPTARNILVKLSDDSGFRKQIGAMIDKIEDKEYRPGISAKEKLTPKAPKNITPLSLGVDEFETRKEKQEYFEEMYEDIYKNKLISSGYPLLAAQSTQKELTFLGGLAVIEVGEKKGLIDEQGEIVGEGCVYSDVELLDNGFFKVTKGDKHGILNKQGEMVGEGCDYEMVRFFDNGFVRLKRKGAKYGLFNKQGEVVGEGCVYDDVEVLGDGFFEVRKGDKVGILTEKGKLLGEGCVYDYVELLDNGFFKIKNWPSYGLLNKQGEEVGAGFTYDYVELLDNGFFKVNQQGWLGVLNKQGEEVGEGCVYDYVELLDNGFFKVSQQGWLGLLNKQGEEVGAGFTYDEVELLDNGFFKVTINDQLGDDWYGILNKQGEEVGEGCVYDYVELLDNGFFKVRKGGKYGLLNKQGEEVGEGRVYKDIELLNNLFFKVTHRDGACGLLSKQGEVLGEGCVYDNIWFGDGPRIRLQKGDKYGLLTEKGKVFGDGCVYDRIQLLNNGLVELKQGEKVWYFTHEGEPYRQEEE